MVHSQEGLLTFLLIGMIGIFSYLGLAKVNELPWLGLSQLKMTFKRVLIKLGTSLPVLVHMNVNEEIEYEIEITNVKRALYQLFMKKLNEMKKI